MIKTIIEIRGAKRFKLPKDGQNEAADVASDISVANMDIKKAKERLRKINTQTSYRNQFGEPPKAAEDYVVIKQKPFRQLDISSYVMPLPAEFIEKWIKINNQDEFTKRIYFTIREIHTIVKNQEAPITTKKQFFLGRQAEKVPRFDKIILAAKQLDRAKSSQQPTRSRMAASIHDPHIQAIINSGRVPFQASAIDPKQFK